jgi:integrase
MLYAARTMPSPQRRPGGLWHYRVTIDGRQRSYYGKTAAEAKRKGEQAKAAALAGLSLGGTVGEWLSTWFGSQRLRVKPATERRYGSIVRTLIRELGSTPMDRLTPGDVTRMEARLADRLSVTSVRHHHVVLGTALTAAVKQGRILTNPVRAVDPPRARHRDKVILSRVDATKLLEAARGDPLEALYLLALTTGMRSGELLALRWRDLDLTAGRLSVNGTIVREVDGTLQRQSTPKTAASRRTIGITARAVQALSAMPPGKPDGLVFDVTPQALLRSHFYPLLIRAGLPRMPFHDLRHTAVTDMLDSGVPVLAVSQLVGHASVALTLSLYGHLTPRMSSQATAAMDARYPV